MRAGSVEAVVVYAADRLSRDSTALKLLKRELEKRVQLEFATATYESSASGDLFFGTSAEFAEYERRVIRERTMRGKQERARKGLFSGGCTPFGYTYTEGKLIPENSQAEIIREIFPCTTPPCRSGTLPCG